MSAVAEAVVETVTEDDVELDDPVIEWRRFRLSKLGFEGDVAETIARERRTDVLYVDPDACGIDLGFIERLVEAGCPLDVAWEIVR